MARGWGRRFRRGSSGVFESNVIPEKLAARAPHTISPPYCVVIGPTWHPALAWKAANPGKPFVGLRLDPDDREIWVICERVVHGVELPPVTLQAVGSAIESEGLDAGEFDDVLIVQARTIGQGHRVASRLVQALEGLKQRET